jgi:rod shape-determining protein MreC
MRPVGPEPGRSRAVLGLLVLACVTIITLDARHGARGSPVDPLRYAVARVVGPVEVGGARALKPLTDIPSYFGSVHRLRAEYAEVQAENAALLQRLRVAQANSHRNAEVDSIARFADTAGYHVVQAQVVGMGPAQSFSRTVTIDAGTRAGVAPDLTVIDADGLVGRVLSATPTTATVLLIVDSDSTVGSRLGDSMELGFLDGGRDVSGDGTLQLRLVDHTVSARIGDTVLTWGSRNGAPYLPGIPVGTVVGVHSSPAELTETAQVRPFVDFSSLDVVGVITGSAFGGHTEIASRGTR